MRLFPALIFMLVVYLIVLNLFGNFEVNYSDIALIALYAVNLALAFGFRSASTVDLNYTWSLCIEEQFYLLWPVILLFILKKYSPKVLIYVTMIIASASMLELYYLAQTNSEAHVYYGTDTRMGILLFGCALAIVFNYFKPWDNIPKVVEMALPIIAVLGILACIISNAPIEHGKCFYRYFFITIFTVIMIACSVHSENKFRLTKQILSNKILVWFGQRSYSIYLWHCLLIVLTIKYDVKIHAKYLMPLALLLPELSYRYVERPFQLLKNRIEKRNALPTVTVVPYPVEAG